MAWLAGTDQSQGARLRAAAANGGSEIQGKNLSDRLRHSCYFFGRDSGGTIPLIR
jgi:hypothetical protein